MEPERPALYGSVERQIDSRARERIARKAGEAMRHSAATAFAAVLLVAGAPADAAEPYDYLGGCQFHPAPVAAQPGQQQDGVLAIVAIAISSNPAENPVTASLVCEVRVDGVVQTSLAAVGTPAMANAAPTAYSTATGDTVEVCETLTFQGWWSTTRCHDAVGVSAPPGDVEDALDTAASLVEALTDAADPQLCPVLQTSAGAYGALTVTGQGDVYLGADPVWDCPPYDADGSVNRRRSSLHAGGITITDDGATPVWTVNGIFADRRYWRGCYRASSTGPVEIVCEPAGGNFRKCDRTVLTAVALPTFTVGRDLDWGRVRTSGVCMGAWYTQRASSETAAQPPDQVKTRVAWLSQQWPWRVMCVADIASWTGTPKPRYFADCQFRFT